MKDRIDDAPFHPATMMVPRIEFFTAGTAFTAYLIGALLLFMNRGMEAFFLLTMALTVNILDAYSFPLLNWLSGSKSSLLLGTAGNRDDSGIPDGIFFLRPGRPEGNRKRMRSFYRLGFSGGVVLLFSSITHLILLIVHPSVIVAGSILAITGFFSFRIYHYQEEDEESLLHVKRVTGELLRDGNFRSWIIILTGSPSQTRRFLSRYRKHLLTTGVFFLHFDATFGEKTAEVNLSEGLLTGYGANGKLLSSLTEAAGKNNITMKQRKKGLDFDCLIALARGYRAVSATFSSRLTPLLLCDSLIEVNRVQ